MGPISLNVGMETISANSRNTYTSLSLGDTIAVVPILGGVGYKTVYEPANPSECFVPAFSVNVFKLSIKDSATGHLVDFRGIDWVITIKIEFVEINNQPIGDGIQGNFDKQMPIYHGQQMGYAGVNADDRNTSLKRSRPTGVQ